MGKTIGTILFIAGFLLIIFLGSEEFGRVWQRLRAWRRGRPRGRLILYPLLVLLIAAAGIIIVTTLIKFATTCTFSYE